MTKPKPRLPNPRTQNIIYWLEDIQEFVYYTDQGYYAPITKERVIGEIRDLMGNPTITTSEANNALLNYKIDHHSSNDIMTNLHYIALKNGTWDTAANILIDHDPMAKTRLFIPRNYLKTQTEIPPLWEKLLEAFDFGKSTLLNEMGEPIGFKTHPIKNASQTDKQIWKQFLINMVHFWPNDRILPILIGFPDAGKSPNLKIIKYMLGDDLVRDVRINQLGKAGELNEAYLAPIWIQEESNMGFVDNETIVVIKKNYSDDSTLPIRLLYKNKFEVKGNRYIIGASNQCFRMADTYNESGTFKRLCPLLCPNRFQKDLELEKTIKDPPFLDQLFSYLLNQPILPAIGDYPQIDFQQRNMTLWNWSAYPISRICQELYDRDYQIGSIMDEDSVVKTVYEKIQLDGLEVPKKLPHLIEEALAEMGISHKRRKDGDVYVGIIPKGATPSSKPKPKQSSLSL